MVTVHKIGGGILKDAESYQRVARILEKYGPGQVAVVSALFGVTDRLDHVISDLPHEENAVESFTQELLQDHLLLLRPIQNPVLQKEISRKLMDQVSRLSKILYGAKLLGEITPRTLDLVHSFGERLSVRVLDAHLKETGAVSQAFDADEAGLITDERFGNALPDFRSTEKNLKTALLPFAEKGVAVFTGYFGKSSNGHVTTLGRGGSDFSAGIVAHALDAEKLIVWKDVPGFLSADPKVVPSARLIALLSYEEAEELGYYGAKILHPKTIEPLRKKRIPVEIRNVERPDAVGTVIGQDKNVHRSVAKSVAVKPDSSLVCIRGAALTSMTDVALPLLEIIRERNVPIDALATSQADLSFCVESKFLPEVQDALLRANGRIRASVFEDVALLGLVGEGMRHTVGVSGRLFSTLAAAGVNVRFIAQGASEINITVAVSRPDSDKALKAVHAEFIEKA